MNNNPSGSCSSEDTMSNNVSNNKIPSEGMNLEVVDHVAQGSVSGSGRDDTDNTDGWPG